MFSRLLRRSWLGLPGRWIVVLRYTLGDDTVTAGVYEPVLPYHRDPEICKVNEGKTVILRHT
jgi:hypothetical protein